MSLFSIAAALRLAHVTQPLEPASKFLSLVLRHQPDAIGVALDAQGWANIDELIARSGASKHALTRAMIDDIVATSDKQRFAISADGQFIRANQGHSLKVDLGLVATAPPTVLFHGTASRFLDSIRADGLLASRRQHVHLSASTETAVKVGSRHGRPVVLTVNAGKMADAGHVFFVSDNGVWLTDAVPVVFLDFG